MLARLQKTSSTNTTVAVATGVWDGETDNGPGGIGILII
jgi:hypothetical protein